MKQVSQQGDIFPVWEEPLGIEGKHYPTARNYFYILYLKPLSLVIFLLLHLPLVFEALKAFLKYFTHKILPFLQSLG